MAISHKISSCPELSWPRSVHDTRSVPGSLLKVRFPAMVPALTHNDRVLPEQASLMHRTEDLGDFSVGVRESRTPEVPPPRLCSQMVLSPCRSVRKYKHHWGNLEFKSQCLACPQLYRPFWICTAPEGSARLEQWVINKCKSVKPENSRLTLMSTLTRVQKTVASFLPIQVEIPGKHTHIHTQTRTCTRTHPLSVRSKAQPWAMSGTLNCLAILSCQTILQNFPGSLSS